MLTSQLKIRTGTTACVGWSVASAIASPGDVMDMPLVSDLADGVRIAGSAYLSLDRGQCDRKWAYSMDNHDYPS